MPEGDTIFRSARTLHRALAGRVVTRFESVYPALTRIDHDAPLTGRTIEAVSARGKHLLMAFSGDLVLHTHMRMHGSWHIYKPGERWQAPGHDMRVRLDTSAYVAVGFTIPVAEFLSSAQLARHPQLQQLGADLADPHFDRPEVRRRFAEQGAAPLHDVLMNQRVLAGIGNVLKSEVLFVARLNPFASAGSLDDEAFGRLMEVAQSLMAMNIAESERTAPTTGRRTTRSLDPSAGLYVYGRAGKPCRICGAPVAMRKAGRDARTTYWCAGCQPALRDAREPG